MSIISFILEVYFQVLLKLPISPGNIITRVTESAPFSSHKYSNKRIPNKSSNHCDTVTGPSAFSFHTSDCLAT